MKEKMFVLVIGIIFVLFGASIIPSISGINKSLSEDKGTAHQMQIFGYSGADVKVDPDPTRILQNEISLELIPGTYGQPSLLVAAYNDYPYSGGPGLGVSRSTNGGVNWIDMHILPPLNPYTGLSMDDAFDPTVTIDTQGNVFIGHISSDSFWYSGMYIHKSIDGGVSFLPPVTIALDLPPGSPPDPNFRFNDRCQITADIFSTSPYTDNIYVAWIKDRGLGMSRPTSDIYFSYSTDNGNTFSQAATINKWTHDLANMPVPAVSSDGTIYVSWLNYSVWTGGVGTIFLDKSTDGGATWGTDINVSLINLPPLSLTIGNGLQDVISKGAPVLKVSPSNSNELYITYAADPDGSGNDEADIFFIKSIDGGITWSSPIRVNDDATNNDQHLPWMDVKPDGTIDIAWYDRRNDANDLLWDVFVARSVNGGNTYSTNIQINDQSFVSPKNPWDVWWMGEYLGLAADSTHAYLVFTSSVNDTYGDVYFDKIANTNLPLSGPDLSCEGSLTWTDVKPDNVVTGSFNVKNVGETGSELSWKVDDYPTWGSWTFSESSGGNLKPEDGPYTISVTVTSPSEKEETFSGEIKLVNEMDSSDTCTIPVSLVTPKSTPFVNLIFFRFLENNHPNIFQLLHQLLGL